MTTRLPFPRLLVVDALRGFAIVSIMLLHNIEHFDFYYRPEGLPAWMVSLDSGIWKTLFFIFGGKSYAIFAMLFGLTFFIQSENQRQKGNDFGGRFIWRLVLLFGFGMINSIFYQGDILTLYAIVGLLIIPFSKLSNKLMLSVIIVLMAQPLYIYKLIVLFMNTDIPWENPHSWSYFGKAKQYLADDSFIATAWGNLTNGKTAVIVWSWEKGRYFQMLALFLSGIILGRKQLFVESEESKKFWIKTLILSSITFISLLLVQHYVSPNLPTEATRKTFRTIEQSWANIAFMLTQVSAFVLIFRSNIGSRILNLLSPIGKMSLSNYVIQSIIGSFIYYGFGLGLYQYTGPTYSFIIGAALVLVLGGFCHFWMSKHKHGPLEYLWHKATWVQVPEKTN